MRRHLETSMGTLSLDRDSMGLVRKAQMFYHRDGKEMSEIAEELGVSLSEAARAVAYPTHFFSVYDLPIPEEDGDIFEYLMSDRLSVSAEEIALRALAMESLHEQFQSLSKREQDILGKSFGVFGYPKTVLLLRSFNTFSQNLLFSCSPIQTPRMSFLPSVVTLRTT